MLDPPRHEGHGRREGQAGPIPTKKQDAKRVKKQVKAASKLAKKLVAGQGVPGGKTVKAGNDKKGVATLAFFPDSKTVKTGEAVKFTMSNKSTEVHNVAFAPEAYAKQLAQSVPRPERASIRSRVYPSEPPGTAAGRQRHQPRQRVREHRHARRRRGDAAAQERNRAPSPSPGRMQYYCIVHGAEMKGTRHGHAVSRSLRNSLAPVAMHGGGSGVPDRRAGRGGKRARRPQIGSNFFAPGKLTVKTGDKVRFMWEEFGFEAHDVNVRKGPAKFHSPLQAGGTWTTKKLTKAGKYSLFCSQHPSDMTMTLTVKKR